MKLQWIAERGRLDVRLPVPYLTTCLTKAMTQVWRKLLVLQSTIGDDRVMGIDDLAALYRWIDASYAVCIRT